MAGAPGSAGTLPPADLLPVQRHATFAYRLLHMILAPVLRAVLSFRIEGRKNLPREGNFIVIANHLNWLDPFAVLLACPIEPRVHFLGNPEGLVTHRLQWRIVRSVGGYIAVDQAQHGDTNLYRYVDLCLERGGSVALFPEGHYGEREGEMQPFKRGFAHFALDSGVPVVPLAILGAQDLWLRKPIRILIGEPIAPNGHDLDSLVTLAERRMADLLPDYVQPPGPRLLRKTLTNLL